MFVGAWSMFERTDIQEHLARIGRASTGLGPQPLLANCTAGTPLDDAHVWLGMMRFRHQATRDLVFSVGGSQTRARGRPQLLQVAR